MANINENSTMNHDNNVLAAYLKEINNIPLLTAEEETNLAIQAAKGDKAAKEKIITANLRFVVNVAKRYRNRGLDLEELISEGNIGLIVAIDKFDVSKGYKFISYAVWWIRQSILKAINEKSTLIRIPANKISELSRIDKAFKSLDSNNKDSESISKVAQMLGLEKKHVEEMINISKETISLDNPIQNTKTETNLCDLLEDSATTSPEAKAIQVKMSDDINSLLETLSEKEASVIKDRFGLETGVSMSLKEIGNKLNLTKERIRQIEKKAIFRLKKAEKINVLAAYVA